jgi:predicted acetyltransferase
VANGRPSAEATGDPGVDIRAVSEGDVDRFVASVGIPFLAPHRHDDEESTLYRANFTLGRSWLAWDGDRVVGNAQVSTRTVTVPGPAGQPCPEVSLGAIAAVGVHPTHRRRGILRRFMATMLDQARERGEVLVGLTASEVLIYGRFGFGPAAWQASIRVPTADATFARPVTAGAGITLISAEEAAEVLPEIMDRARRRRAGEVSRPAEDWAFQLADPAGRRHGASAAYYAVTEGGFVRYRARERDATGVGEVAAVAVVEDLMAVDDEVAARLWRYLLDIDLIDRVDAWVALDDPLRWRLADRRLPATTAVNDGLWLRVLDVPAALEARRYGRGGTLVVEVLGADEPGVTGTWVLDVDDDGIGHCAVSAARREPDLRLALPELASLYLGGVAATTLRAAGTIEEAVPGAARRANDLFASAPAPCNSTEF